MSPKYLHLNFSLIPLSIQEKNFKMDANGRKDFIDGAIAAILDIGTEQLLQLRTPCQSDGSDQVVLFCQWVLFFFLKTLSYFRQSGVAETTEHVINN